MTEFRENQCQILENAQIERELRIDAILRSLGYQWLYDYLSKSRIRPPGWGADSDSDTDSEGDDD